MRSKWIDRGNRMIYQGSQIPLNEEMYELKYRSGAAYFGRLAEHGMALLNIDAIVTDLFLLNIVKRLIKLVMVVLPAPVAPTKATTCTCSAKDWCHAEPFDDPHTQNQLLPKRTSPVNSVYVTVPSSWGCFQAQSPVRFVVSTKWPDSHLVGD